MSNPNDTTADIYDIYIQPLKGPEVTAAELALINSIIKPHSHILDIGGGTGRHAIPLAQAGHQVNAIDSSDKMLAKLQEKAQALALEIQTIHADILQHEITDKYDLIIMMWNSFNEIALTEDEALNLLRKCKLALTDNGKILINSDNPENFDPAALFFTTEFETDNFTYSQDWKVSKFDQHTNTTTSQETIQVKNIAGEIVRQEKNQIMQRWWSLEEINNLASRTELTVKQESIVENAELYLMLLT